jgi:hypothetical protein
MPPKPPPPGIDGALSFSFFSTTTHSVVRSSPAMDAAFYRAFRTRVLDDHTDRLFESPPHDVDADLLVVVAGPFQPIQSPLAPQQRDPAARHDTLLDRRARRGIRRSARSRSCR